MLSKTSSKLLIIVVKCVSFFGGLPIEWDGRRSKVKITPKGWTKWYLWLSAFLVNWVYTIIRHIYIPLATYRRLKRENAVLKVDPDLLKAAFFNGVKGFQMLLILIVLGVVSCSVYEYHLEFVCFLNSVIRYAQHFRNCFVRRLGRGWRNGCESILRGILGVIVIFPFCIVVFFASDPSHPTHMTSLLPSDTPRYLYWTICIMYGSFLFIWSTSAISAITIFVFMGVLSFYLATGMIKEVRPHQYYYMTRPSLRKPPHLCQFYRSLQILNRLGNNALANGLPLLKTSCEGWAVICNACVIAFWRMESGVSRSLLILFPNTYFMAWLLTLKLSGELWKQSGKCIMAWKTVRFKTTLDRMIMKKFQRSCTPVKIHVGGFYFVKPVRVLSTINSVVVTTLKVLLLFAKKARA